MKKLYLMLAPLLAFGLAAGGLWLLAPRFAWAIAMAAAWLLGLTGSFVLRRVAQCSVRKQRPFRSVPDFLAQWVYDGMAMVPALVLMLLLLLLPGALEMPWVRIPLAALICAGGTLIFPRLLARPLQVLQKVLNEETISYLVFGVLTTVVNIVCFWVFSDKLGITELIANVIAWLISVMFAYVTNRLFVFCSKAAGMQALLREIGLFFAARLLSLGIDEGGMYVCLYLLLWNKMAAKVFVNVLVIIFNYFASKLLIFRKAKNEN